MNLFFNVILAILVFLAVSSGLTKVLLIQQDVDFFGQYGFTNPILIAYGVVQVVGGILLLLPKTRVFGAGIVAITFLISAVVLGLAGQTLMLIVTLLCVGLLFLVGRRANGNNSAE